LRLHRICGQYNHSRNFKSEEIDHPDTDAASKRKTGIRKKVMIAAEEHIDLEYFKRTEG
jgi:hypothetical protein